MSNPFIGEIRMFGGSFAPAGWAFCDGQLLPISENDALFVLLGTTYGGDGQETFALPNLQSRVPLHMGTGPGGTYTLGENGGVELVTLTGNQIPIHSHPLLASADLASLPDPVGSVLAQSRVAGVDLYIEENPNVAMANPASITPIGGSQPHSNIQPYLTLSFIISLFGVFPPPS